MRIISLLLVAGCGAAPLERTSLDGATLLSETGLYDGTSQTYEPNFKLWSDGAKKTRWIRLPEGEGVDTAGAPWSFPIGTRFFKEFVKDGRRIETRVLSREGEDRWFMGAFVWRDDQSDADLVEEGMSNADGAGYDVPSVDTCALCHQGSPNHVLGYSALQLEAELDASDPISRGLGYLHANCGHCHNEHGLAGKAGIDMVLRLELADGRLDPTRVLASTIMRPTAAGKPRIVPGHPEESAIIDRMTRSDGTRMPPVGTHAIDADGVLSVSRMIEALEAQ